MKKHLNAAIRNLTSLSTECLRFGDSALMAEVQAVLIRLLEIQECESACNTDPLSPVIGTEN